MAFVLADRVQETTTTTGTGTLTLAGAVTNYRSFAAIGNGNTTYYAIIDNTNNVWEVGQGTYTSVGTTLSRTTIFANSSGTTAALTLAAGTKNVICTQPAWSTNADSNIGLGYQAFAALSSGTNNTALGYQTLNAVSSGGSNTAIGYQAGKAITTNSSATAVGYQALTAHTSGNGTGVGYQAGSTVVGALGFTGLGYWAGHGNVSGNYQTHVGMYAGGSVNANQADTVTVGYGAGYNGAGIGTTAIGSNSMQSGNANYSTAVGYYSLYNGAGAYCTAMGYYAMYGNAGATGGNNVAIGYSAMFNAAGGAQNTIVGASAGANIGSGNNNVCMGYTAGNALSSGAGNTMLGTQTGYPNITTHSNNTAVGYQAMFNFAASNNIAIGPFALSTSGGTGTYNAVFVYSAGKSITSGTGNVILGSYSGSGGAFDVTTTAGAIIIANGGSAGTGDGTVRQWFGPSGLGGLNGSLANTSTTSATASTGTINFDAGTQQTLYYTTAATANFTINVRASSTVTLNTAMMTGQSLSIQFLCTNGATAYYMSAFTIDGTSVTPKWITGTAPSAGNINAVDLYTIQIIKTAASTYTVLAKQEKYA